MTQRRAGWLPPASPTASPRARAKGDPCKRRAPVAAAAALGCLALGASPAAADLVANGGFESGNTGFGSEYVFVPLPSTNLPPGGLWDAARYGIGGSANSFHVDFTGLPRSGANFMIVNGGDVANEVVWSQAAISVMPGASYILAAWVASVSPSNPARLAFSVNGTQIGATLGPSATVGQWSLFSETWNSGAATTASLAIVNRNTSAGGNDFGLDDISLAAAPAAAVPAPAALGVLGAALFGPVAVRRPRT